MLLALGSRAWLGARTSRPGGVCLARFAQRLNDHRQHVSRGNIFERPRNRLREFNVGIELRDKFPDEGHVNRTRNDVDPIRPDISLQFYFADHH